MDKKISYRRIEERDMAFLSQVYASTREQEMLLTGWPEGEVNKFLAMQFEAQHRYYLQVYDQGEEFLVILKEGKEIGRLYIGRWKREIRIIDITLLPKYRNVGIGHYIISELLAEANQKGIAVSIHVEKTNPALRLYQRLGFIVEEDKGVYWKLSRLPQKGH